jgi:hypothetical protein
LANAPWLIPMESASNTDDGSTKVAQRKRLHKRESTAAGFAQNDGTVYENKAFNSIDRKSVV